MPACFKNPGFHCVFWNVPVAAPLSCPPHSVNREVQPAHGTAPRHLRVSTRNTTLRWAQVWFTSCAGPRAAAHRNASHDIKCSCLSILSHCCIGCLPRVLKGEGGSQKSISQNLFKIHETKAVHDNLRQQVIHMPKWQGWGKLISLAVQFCQHWKAGSLAMCISSTSAWQDVKPTAIFKGLHAISFES